MSSEIQFDSSKWSQIFSAEALDECLASPMSRAARRIAVRDDNPKEAQEANVTIVCLPQ